MDKLFRIGKISGASVLTSLMSLYAFIMAVTFQTTDRWICFLAMFVSSIGDIIMSNETNVGKKIGKKRLLIGGIFFAAAHILYSVCYYSKNKDRGYGILNTGFYIALCVSFIALITIIILGQKKKNSPVSYLGAILYLCMISCASTMIFAFSFSAKGIAFLALVGSLSFLLSDYIIGVGKFANIKKFDSLVWWLYPIGQILIITFG